MKGKITRKSLRRGRNKLKKLVLFSIPILILALVILIIFIVMLITSLRRPLYISPLSTLGIQAIRSNDDVQLQILGDLLKKNKISYTKINKTPDSSYIITIENGGDALVSFKKDINEQLSSLQFILSRLTMEGKQFVRLDLRFDKPVIIQK